jgi:hypothetical protein
MHLLDGKKGILSPKKGLVFELRPQLAAFYRGPTPMENWRGPTPIAQNDPGAAALSCNYEPISAIICTFHQHI